MLLVLFGLFVVGPLVELYVIIQVAHVIGAWQTIALLIIESMFGAWLIKRQGMGMLDRISRALEEKRVPGRELVDGFLILFAGVLMLTPGFLTDVLGFLLLLPPTRALVRRLLTVRFKQGRYGRAFTVASGPARGATRFVGSFWAGDVQDVTGSDARSRKHPVADLPDEALRPPDADGPRP